MIEEFSVLLCLKGKWFCPIWANQWQQVVPDTIFKALSPTLTRLVCSTEPWWEGEIVCEFVTWMKSLYVYCMLEGLLFMHYPSMCAIDGQLNRLGQWSNCQSIIKLTMEKLSALWCTGKAQRGRLTPLSLTPALLNMDSNALYEGSVLTPEGSQTDCWQRGLASMLGSDAIAL